MWPGDNPTHDTGGKRKGRLEMGGISAPLVISELWANMSNGAFRQAGTSLTRNTPRLTNTDML